MYRLIDGEIHKRNSDGHYMPLTLAEADDVVARLNAFDDMIANLAVPPNMLSKAVDLLNRMDDSDTEPPKDSQ